MNNPPPALQLQDVALTLKSLAGPVDILTREMTLASGLPAERVIGTGTMHSVRDAVRIAFDCAGLGNLDRARESFNLRYFGALWAAPEAWIV